MEECPILKWTEMMSWTGGLTPLSGNAPIGWVFLKNLHYSRFVINMQGNSRDQKFKVVLCRNWKIKTDLKLSVYLVSIDGNIYWMFQDPNFCTGAFWIFDHVTCPAYYQRTEFKLSKDALNEHFFPGLSFFFIFDQILG